MINLSFFSEFSHVDSITPEGGYLGVHCKRGCKERKKGYGDNLAKGETVIEIPCTEKVAEKFYEESRKYIGHDWGIISNNNDCSGFQLLMLLQSHCIEITPEDLYEILKKKYPEIKEVPPI